MKLWRALIGLFQFLGWISSQVDKKQAGDAARAEQNNVNLSAQVQVDEKEISDMRDQKDFDDRLNSDPAYAERVRQLLNADAAAPPKKP